MDKRKQSSPDGRISKRRRHTPSATPERDSGDSPAEVGRQLLKTISEEKDRKGRLIAEPFQVLPEKSDLPDYFEVIKNPIALDIIETKLETYKTVSELVDDLDLMTSNAQEYNRPNSVIYGAAVKIKNLVHKELASHLVEEQPMERRSGRTARRVASADETENAEIREALIAVVKDMTEVKDANGDGAIDHFMDLPLKRHYPDYYQTIKYPTCIKEIRRKLRKDEFKEPSPIDAFELEVMRMFANAVEYNAEGSEILDDVERLKDFFIPRMAEEREKFGKPSVDLTMLVLNGKPGNSKSPSSDLKIKIHLNVPESNGIKLRINNKFGAASNKQSVEEAVPSDDKMDIDETMTDAKITPDAKQVGSENGKPNNTLKREASGLGKVSSPAARSPKKPTPPIPTPAQHTTRSSSKSATPGLQPNVPSKGNDIKLGSASPAPTVRAGQPMMSPTPSVGSNPVSNAGQSNLPASKSPNPSSAAPVPQAKPAPAAPLQASFGDRKSRREGKTIHDSPIQRLHIQTSPRIQTRERVDISLFPDEKLWFTSHTLHLSGDNNVLSVTAYMHPKVASRETLSSISLTLNGNRVKNTENPQAPNGGLYSWDLPLARGTTNSIECTSTMKPKPTGTTTETPDEDIEKVHFVVFAFLAPKF